MAHTPLAVGFGIATPDQAAAVGKIADGVIVGSAMIRAIESDPIDPVHALSAYVASLAEALRSGDVMEPLLSPGPLPPEIGEGRV